MALLFFKWDEHIWRLRNAVSANRIWLDGGWNGTMVDCSLVGHKNFGIVTLTLVEIPMLTVIEDFLDAVHCEWSFFQYGGSGICTRFLKILRLLLTSRRIHLCS